MAQPPRNPKTRIVITGDRVLTDEEQRGLVEAMFTRHGQVLHLVDLAAAIKQARSDVRRTELRGIVGVDALIRAAADYLAVWFAASMNRPPAYRTVERQCREAAAEYWRSKHS